MRLLLLPYATTGWSLIAGWYLSGATPRGQPRTPAMMLPHGGEGLRMRRMTVLWTFRRPFMGRPVPRQFLRNALLDLTTIVPATAYHRRSYAERYSRFIPLACSSSFIEQGGHESLVDTASFPGEMLWHLRPLVRHLPSQTH